MKYTKDALIDAAQKCDTITDVVRMIRKSDTVSPSSINLVSQKLKEFNIDTSHFVGSLKGHKNLLLTNNNKRRHYDEILVHNKNAKKRQKRSTIMYALESEGSVKYICNICGNPGIHNNKELILQLDHIDGNWKNDKVTNLRYLCPNCHTQTPTYGFKEVKY